MSDLDKALELHERLEVIYVVDGYSASLYGDDGDRLIAEADGATIATALEALAVKVAR